MIDPVSYFEMIWLLKNCTVVVTDSGGLQKEAYFFKKYCVTIREQTEWVELTQAGVNKLVVAVKSNIVAEVSESLTNVNSISPFKDNIYGDGNAAKSIVSILIGRVL